MGDSYRPRNAPLPRRNGRSLTERTTFANGGDSYRPNAGPRNGYHNGSNPPRQAEFTFSSSHQGPRFPPAGPSSERNARRPQNNFQNRNRNRNHGGASAGSRDYAGGQRARGFSKPAYSRAAHSRALLQSRDYRTEQVLGVSENSSKFRDLDELSNDEESDMDTSTDTDDDVRKRKLARKQSANQADGNSVPKWSNPDPYTVLPPSETTAGPKRDIVKLIRKAKNDAIERGEVSNAVTSNDDFISFGDDDEALDIEPFQGSLNEVVASGALASTNPPAKRNAEIAGLPDRPLYSGIPDRPAHPGKALKRGHAHEIGVFYESWQPLPYINTAPWAGTYEAFESDPFEW